MQESETKVPETKDLVKMPKLERSSGYWKKMEDNDGNNQLVFVKV